MKAAIVFALLAAIAPGIAFGATPEPAASGTTSHKVPSTLANPGSGNPKLHKMTGAGCIGPRVNAAQAATNPITGRPQAAPIVQIPIGGGNTAVATNRAQQNQACFHPH
jgi:hypothetical protein